jgi:hypothetical protein
MRAVLAPIVAALAACTGTASTTDDTATATTTVAATGAQASGGGCASTPAEARTQVDQLEQRWETAFYRRDSAFFGRTLDDDFVLAGGPAAGGKKDYMADLMKGPPVPDSITGGPAPMDEVRALSNDVVVVSGVWTNKAAPTEKAAYTEVFVCRDGQWKAVHGHYNAVAPAGR